LDKDDSDLLEVIFVLMKATFVLLKMITGDLCFREKIIFVGGI
jgi:hypothetical protein